ncbi:hypothetical protein L7F22_023225 [Adiantum nelumboides]|nr:hypothetical protein [Adiantum nelumboides]
MASQRMGSETTRQAQCRSPFAQLTRRSCSCNLCWRRGSSSPSCSKSATPEVNRDYPCLRCERLPREVDGYGFSPTFLPPQHSGPLYPPRASDGTPTGDVCAHEAFPASTWISPSRISQEKCQEQKNGTLEPPSMKGCGVCSAQPNQITLYSWYLVRCIGWSDSVKVSIGGFMGTAGTERFETGAIVRRLGKCRLLAQDGVEVRLAGLIDDLTTITNGFSVNLVQSFLSGFPYTWNHLLDNEFHVSSTNGLDHQVLGDCGLGAVAEMSQLSFEDCCLDRERRTPLSTQKQVLNDHLATCNDVELNTKQSRTEEAQREKESKSSGIQAVLTDNEASETGVLKCDLLKTSKVTVTSDQDIFDSNNTAMEELQAKVLIDQSMCKVKQKPGRKPRPHLNKERGDGALSAQLNQLPRVTRSSCKISRPAAGNGEQEDFRPFEHSKLCSFSSPLIQESNSDMVDGGEVLVTSLCNNPVGIETPERSLNAEASRNFRDDGAISQAENVTEVSPVKVCNDDAEKEDSRVFNEISEAQATPLCKRHAKSHTKIKKSNEKEDLIFSRSARQCSKRPVILPPLPCPRVPITKELISTAFGLKTSRSGRLLVPPLAHWCGQSLLRDKDGGIIAISDGSKDKSHDGTGSFKFKPPAGERLQRLQKRLCEAATDRRLSKKKRFISKKSC